MKKIFILLFVVSVLLAGLIYAADTEVCNLNISLINQDPYPTIPGSYVKVVFQVGGVQNPNCESVIFELIPSYPFSLDENDGLRSLEGSTWTPDYKTDWLVPYTLRVDKDALDGDSQIKVRYSTGKSDVYVQKDFTITVEDARTSFDAVLQESSTDSGNTDISIAIANSGEYTANAVVVRIPEQEDFKVIGSDGQMVGNLESGDYTIVSFSISPKRAVNAMNSSRSIQQPHISIPTSSGKLKFDVYYTDGLGVRRVVNMNLSLSIGSGNSSMQNAADFAGRAYNRNSGFSWSIWYIGAIIAVVLIAIFAIVHKIRKRNHSKEHSKVPDWVKKVKEREKSK